MQHAAAGVGLMDPSMDPMGGMGAAAGFSMAAPLVPAMPMGQCVPMGQGMAMANYFFAPQPMTMMPAQPAMQPTMTMEVRAPSLPYPVPWRTHLPLCLPLSSPLLNPPLLCLLFPHSLQLISNALYAPWVLRGISCCVPCTFVEWRG